jgi:hypothetical protein
MQLHDRGVRFHESRVELSCNGFFIDTINIRTTPLRSSATFSNPKPVRANLSLIKTP